MTQGAYRRVTGKNPSSFKGADYPVDSVTWEEAEAYCFAIGGRLPTEAEWEFASRAGTNEARYGNLDRIAWYSWNSGKSTHPVKQKDPNSWGLYDMLGNLWEWVEDLYPGTRMRMLRGGSWLEPPALVRSSARGKLDPSSHDRIRISGLRCKWE